MIRLLQKFDSRQDKQNFTIRFSWTNNFELFKTILKFYFINAASARDRNEHFITKQKIAIKNVKIPNTKKI